MAAGLLLAGPAPWAASPVWPADGVGRLEALAVLQTLNADLLSHDSATLTLDRWCAQHHLAQAARIVAERVAGDEVAPSAQIREDLGVDARAAVRYRHVRLRCGGLVLSDAENWYVPARLTPSMNHVLETTDTSFGRVVQSLHFQRHTRSVELLWHPLPAGWEMTPALPTGSGTLFIPDRVLRHRAVLTTADGSRSARWSRPIPVRCWPFSRARSGRARASSGRSPPS